jgi:translation initiation factor 2 beta subunit (eIF-2beta)/eIF-5
MSLMRNIDASSSDKFYRYKRSSVEITYKNTGKGQTKIENIQKISYELETKPHDLVSYLRKKLNVATDETGLVHAKIDRERIETAIDKFIALYVLCPSCKLPEFHSGRCNACGFDSTMPSQTSEQTNSIAQKELIIREKNRMLRDIHTCLNQPEKQIPKELPTQDTELQTTLANYMKILYEMRSRLSFQLSAMSRNRESIECKVREIHDQIDEIDYIIDCCWGAPDVDEIDSGRVISGRFADVVKRTISFIKSYLEGATDMKMAISKLVKLEKYKKSTDENDDLLKHADVKLLKALYAHHMKMNRESMNWLKHALGMNIDKLADEADIKK